MTPASIRLSVRQHFQTSPLKPQCQSNFIWRLLRIEGRKYLNDLRMHLSPRPRCLGCCPFWGDDSLVVDLLFNVLLIMGVLCLSLFWYALLCALLSFAIILKRKRELIALFFTVLLISCYCKCSVAFPHDVVGWSGVYDYFISWSYSVTSWFCDQDAAMLK